jgi:hypothetical protein
LRKYHSTLFSARRRSVFGQSTHARAWFWYNVIRKLDRCRLSPEERNRITAAIAKKVGGKVPSKAELKAFERRRARHVLAP